MLAKKLLVFILVFACLIVFWYIVDVVKRFMRNNKKDRKWYEYAILFTAISYILTIMFTGFSF